MWHMVMCSIHVSDHHLSFMGYKFESTLTRKSDGSYAVRFQNSSPPTPPSSRPKPRTYVFIFSGPAATRWDEFESLRFDVCLSCSRGVPRQSYSSSCCSPLVMFFPFFFPFSLSLPLRMMLLLSSVFCFPWKRIAFSLCFPFSELSYTKQKTNLTLHPTTDIKFMSSIRLGGKWKLWENILLQQQGTQPYFFYWFKKKNIITVIILWIK